MSRSSFFYNSLSCNVHSFPRKHFLKDRLQHGQIYELATGPPICSHTHTHTHTHTQSQKHHLLLRKANTYTGCSLIKSQFLWSRKGKLNVCLNTCIFYDRKIKASLEKISCLRIIMLFLDLTRTEFCTFANSCITLCLLWFFLRAIFHQILKHHKIAAFFNRVLKKYEFQSF